MSLIDIAANLSHSSFRHDLDEVIARAHDAGVHQLIAVGTDLIRSYDALALAQRYPQVVFATAGIHPHDAKDWDDATLGRLEELARTSGVVAVGECGLDFNRDFSPRPIQEKVFEAQLELAVGLDMPLYLHQRDAHEHFLPLLKKYRTRLRQVVVHCFTGTGAELDAYLGLDLHIGITGWICDERRGLSLREMVSKIPAQRLMLETDAPFLLPRDLKPKPKSRRNEPLHLPHIAAAVAQCRGEDVETVARTTTENARGFFGI